MYIDDTGILLWCGEKVISDSRFCLSTCSLDAAWLELSSAFMTFSIVSKKKIKTKTVE